MITIELKSNYFKLSLENQVKYIITKVCFLGKTLVEAANFLLIDNSMVKVNFNKLYFMKTLNCKIFKNELLKNKLKK